MDDLKQWLTWKLVDRGGKKPTKVPSGSVTDSSTWVTKSEALARSTNIGFVFTESDPYWLIDIDDALLPDGASWKPHALTLVAAFPGVYVELSQSGTGLHIIGSGTPPAHCNKNKELNIEFYHKERFVAYTGAGAYGSPDVDFTAQLAQIIPQYFAPREYTSGDVQGWTCEPVDSWLGYADDDELIKHARKAKSIAGKMGTAATFAELWDGDVDALAQHYPDPNRSFDESLADAALCQHLAFWTGGDCERMARLLRASGLARDKHERDGYIESTVLLAATRQTEFHRVRPVAEPYIAPPSATAPTTRRGLVISGYQYLDATAQLEHFSGCCYISAVHQVATPSGEMLKPEQFNAVYGGYVFQLDSEMNGKTTRKAWEAFTESQVVRYPRAQRCTFEPLHDPGALIEREGLTWFNTWRPVSAPRVAGDVSPFMSHLEKLLPDAGDRAILLAYMAACVQHQGVKFQWCPLIQGAEGNGKTLLTRVVSAAIGERYTHFPTAMDLGEKFNAWLFGVTFIGIEDIYVPESKAEIMERLKPMITNNRLGKRAMQKDQTTERVCANFMLNSNHHDAVRKTENDRRIAIFYTAQQTADDIARDGMGGDYFPTIYRWLDAGGYAAVAEFLHTYEIPAQLNPATECVRAPVTTSTPEAISLSRGRIEQEIIEAIEEGRAGFRGGWISSIQLGLFLKEIRGERMLPQNKRRAALQSIGYDYHPHLNDGRANRPTLLDGGKPRLFCKIGSIPCGITSPVDVVAAYERAQDIHAGSNKKAS